MAEFFDNALSSLLTSYNSMLNVLPLGARAMVSVAILTIFIVIVALIIWQFYRTLSQRDFIKLNLHRYNLSENPTSKKVIAAVFYIIENILIMPILIILWFVVFIIILFVIAEQPDIDKILLVGAALIAAIRVLAYSVHSLSEDVAKLFPLIMLSVFLLSPIHVNFNNFIGQVQQVPLLFHDIPYFFLAIFLIEIVLRCLMTLSAVWRDED